MKLRQERDSGKIRSWASSRVHDRVMEIVNQTIPSGGRVLDVACGPGALSQRLDAEGFNIVAADGFPEVFRLHRRIPFVKLDVEKEWSDIEGGFDAVCAVEIIEHVENPYLFVRKCFDALNPGGLLVLTTPNAAHYVSRITFLLSGTYERYAPRSFVPKTRTEKGSLLPSHINSFTGWMIRGNFKQAGFENIVISSCTNWLSGLTPIPRRPLNLLRWGFHRFLGTLASPFMRSPAKDSVFAKNIIAVGVKPI